MRFREARREAISAAEFFSGNAWRQAGKTSVEQPRCRMRPERGRTGKIVFRSTARSRPDRLTNVAGTEERCKKTTGHDALLWDLRIAVEMSGVLLYVARSGSKAGFP